MDKPEKRRVRSLTGRERDVLRHAANGLSNGEIAAVLGLKPNTIKSYWKNICGKLSVNDRRSAVRQFTGKAVVRPRLPPKTAPLTDRQREVLAYAAAGLTNREIGAEMRIGENSVKSQLSHAYQRLGVHSRRQAVLTAATYRVRKPGGERRVEPTKRRPNLRVRD